MRNIFLVFLGIFLLSLGSFGQARSGKPNNKLLNRIVQTDSLVALWTFVEGPGMARIASGCGEFPLQEANGAVERAGEGPLSGYSIRLDGSNYLTLSNSDAGDLDIYGEDAEVTVVAWVKWTGEQTGFVCGKWNEYQDGGKRQYGLFVSLPHYNGQDQVCGHISKTGKPTPPFPYSIDYSASEQLVPGGEWVCVAFTYDGEYIKSYMNGEFRERSPELIKNTRGFDGYPQGLVQSKNPYYFPYGIGNNGSDFTVGAVLLKSGMGNFYKGLIGGIAIYKRALTNQELEKLARSSFSGRQ